jgi:hypothetical protein
VPKVPRSTRYWYGGGQKGILVTCALTVKGKPVDCAFVGSHTLDEVMQSQLWYETGNWKKKKPELGERKNGKQWDGWDWVPFPPPILMPDEPPAPKPAGERKL